MKTIGRKMKKAKELKSIFFYKINTNNYTMANALDIIVEDKEE
jgi:hypothetical protein